MNLLSDIALRANKLTSKAPGVVEGEKCLAPARSLLAYRDLEPLVQLRPSVTVTLDYLANRIG